MMKLDNFAKYAWAVLAYNVAVIAWGAYVRATGSGAGCGSHWPLCNGEVIPRAPQVETMIEFTHRITSGVALMLVVGLLMWAWRRYAKGHPVRLGAGLAMFFMITEALVGAALVLFELVAYNTSATRAGVGAIHLINTFLLLAALTVTAWWAAGGQPLQLKEQSGLGLAMGLALPAMLLLGASGAVTALGDTLFPASSLAEGLQQKFSPTAHFLVRLRLWHPIIAIAVGVYVIIVISLLKARQPMPHTHLMGRIFTILYLGQLALGALNVALLAPVWLQLVHLFMSNLLWITLVLLAASAFTRRAPQLWALKGERPVLPRHESFFRREGSHYD
jgi:heme A synthase